MFGREGLKNLVYSAVLLALALALPFLTGQIPEIGNALCPMHIPVLLCGFVCGPLPAAVVGGAAPLLRSLIFGRPVLFPNALCMAFELAAYGLAAGLLNKRLPERPGYVYLSLSLSMIFGRLVWGGVSYIIYALGGMDFTFGMFTAGALFNAVPGIIIQIVLIPPVVWGLRRAGVICSNAKASVHGD